jgi:hypothetical protein
MRHTSCGDHQLNDVTRCADDARVQDMACGALVNLASGCAENKEKIMQDGGDEVVISAMRRHPDNAGIHACGYLCIIKSMCVWHVCVRACACVCAHVPVCMSMCLCVCACVCAHVCVRMCLCV